MRSVLVLLVIIIIAAAGYALYTANQPDSETATQSLAETGAADSLQQDGIGEALKQEAETYIEEITTPTSEPVTATSANEFITGDQTISLGGKQNVELIKPSDLLDQAGLSEDSPVTVITEQEQVETMSVKEILEDFGGRLEKKINILEGEKIRETTVEEVVSEHDSGDSIPVIKKVEQYEIRTPKEILADESIDKNTELRIIREPYRPETTTVDELLMGQEEANGENVFYVRNVTDEDDQGIWGIVHNGLIDNFATGIALRRGETIRKYKITIPRDADEMKENSTSSFLGRLIQQKTAESYVYNFKRGKMGRNPDLIYPGQEIIIIRFSSDELINIYRHFVENVNS